LCKIFKKCYYERPLGVHGIPNPIEYDCLIHEFLCSRLPSLANYTMNDRTLPVITAINYVSIMSTMLNTAYSDPGFLPRSTKQELEYIQRKRKRFEPYVTVSYNGKDVDCHWCSTCMHYKPPKVHHCRSCNNCVCREFNLSIYNALITECMSSLISVFVPISARFDHHCPFVGNCIGQRNYVSFILMLLSVVVSCCFVVSCSITVLILGN
jgi:palmitoyltransferase ZDHHC9/14/18